MLQRRLFLALSSRLTQNRPLSTQDFISQNDAEFTTKTSIAHTPIFSRNLMEFFRQRQEGPDKHFRILDMTFGSGGHTCYILDQFRRSGVQGSIGKSILQFKISPLDGLTLNLAFFQP